MRLLKDILRDSTIASELAQCVLDNQPYRLVDMKVYLTRMYTILQGDFAP